MSTFEVTSDTKPFEAEVRRVHRGLREFNASVIGEADFRLIGVFARDDAGDLIGGLVGATYWKLLHIESLWVVDEHRRHGYATRILEVAESEAVRRGCLGAFLDTFSFQARPLYERLGYRVVGTIPGFPAGHERYFMVKSLEAKGAAFYGADPVKPSDSSQ